MPANSTIFTDIGDLRPSEVKGSNLTLTDGTHTVSGTTQVTVTGATVGGASPNATLTVTGGETARTINVTTGAAPIDITLSDYTNWSALAVLVTSGGTAGTEVLNFIGPDDGEQTYITVGKTINVVFVHQTNPSDIIHITQNTSGSFTCLDNIGNSIGTFSTGVFDEEGNNLVFTFTGDVIQQYRWNCLYGAFDSATVITQQRAPLPVGGAFGQFLVAGPAWASAPQVPFLPFNAGSVANLNTNYPASSYNGATAMVFNALNPVVGSVVASGGSKQCLVISNGTDYLVMFILN